VITIVIVSPDAHTQGEIDLRAPPWLAPAVEAAPPGRAESVAELAAKAGSGATASAKIAAITAVVTCFDRRITDSSNEVM
jgi:hypothetical protein